MPHRDQPGGGQPRPVEGEDHPKKKTLYADEQGRPDVVEARAAFRVEQATCDLDTRVFVDEFGINLDMTRRYARAPQGARAVGSVPGRTAGNITLVFGIRQGVGVVAPNLIRGPMTNELFEAYVNDTLGPALHRGDIVVTDRLNAHTAATTEAAIEAHHAHLELLPPYSPDLTPIENAGAKVKAALRKAAARTWEALVDAAADALRSVTPDDVYGWLKHAGFRPKLE